MVQVFFAQAAARKRLTQRRLTHPTRCAQYPEHPESEIGAVFIEKIPSTSRRIVPWHSHAAAVSRDRSISICPRRSDLIAPDARGLRIRSVTVVRRTPRICDSASWVSGSSSLSMAAANPLAVNSYLQPLLHQFLDNPGN